MSCKSGALLTAKGGTPGPAFQIRLTDDVASTGEALLTSSAANEVTLESREIGGSFFTHYFISGLRGAADTSGDGRITLTEAYRYAYAHTIKTTGETLIGPQHPAYDYQLTGQGELVLAELSKPSARLSLPRGFARVLVTDLAHDEVIAEVGPDAPEVLAVEPGRYGIRAWRGGQIFAGRVAVRRGEERVVRGSELSRSGAVATASKGGDRPAAAPALMIAGGGTGGVTDGIGVVPAARLELVLPSGITATVLGGSRALSSGTTSVRETQLFALAGYRRGIARGRWRAWLGFEAGGGLVVQTGPGPAARSAAVEIGAVAGAALRVHPGASIVLQPALATELLRRDGKTAALALPSIWLGVELAL